MTLKTFLRFLIGDRQAILTAAGTRGLLGLGLLFVLSAGLAREYDAEDLRHEPWHLLLPLAASIVGSFVLYLLVRAVGFLQLRKTPDLPGYGVFLGLYWLTAPLAWLYAVPYERFGSPYNAVAANLWTLALVSVWRVALITRVISVLFGVSAWAAFFVVMLFADAVALVALRFAPLPGMIGIMGGIRISDADRLLSSVSFFMPILGILSGPLWVLGSAGVAAFYWSWQPVEASRLRRASVRPALWGVAGLALLVGLAAMPWTQPEQQHRRMAEDLLRDGRVPEAVAFLSRFDQGDLPPHWDPPPRAAYGDQQPDLAEVLLAMERSGGRPAWLRAIYLDKLRWTLEDSWLLWDESGDPQRKVRLLELLEILPEGPQLVRVFDDARRLHGRGDRSPFPAEHRERFNKLLEAAGIEPTKEPAAPRDPAP